MARQPTAHRRAHIIPLEADEGTRLAVGLNRVDQYDVVGSLELRQQRETQGPAVHDTDSNGNLMLLPQQLDRCYAKPVIAAQHIAQAQDQE
ncbi:MAG: hypothetical protein OEO20_06685 [Gemmatimonadota bacterium]|nr:hypothetical protein [Gemmatimonadota bacterium]MDH3477972.1 hypothetical protein [Gemmatimonadota bacterium]MDH3569503.1 hypothetical protein [Gemmatimonadota bacterium]MDH5549771.1 hypothetical protein [Gemmatimonadota bacterium]